MSENETNTNSKASGPSKGMKIAGGIVAGLVVIGIIGAVFGDDDTSTSSDDSAKKPTETTEVTNAAKKNEKKDEKKKDEEVEEKSTPREDLINAIEDIDDDAKVTLKQGDLTVTYPLKTNVTVGMMADVGRKTTADIINVAQDSDARFSILNINAETELVDEYGAESTDSVVSAIYTRQVVDKIQTDSVDLDTIWDLADVESYVHPEFQ